MDSPVLVKKKRIQMIHPTPAELNSELFILDYKEFQGGRPKKLLDFLGDMSLPQPSQGTKKEKKFV